MRKMIARQLLEFPIVRSWLNFLVRAARERTVDNLGKILGLPVIRAGLAHETDCLF
jgi:hypothetical protein